MPLYFCNPSGRADLRLRDGMRASPHSMADHQRNPQAQKNLDLALTFSSILIQLGLGLFFGHIYDMRINMATGYLVGTGQNPYIAQDLSAIFNNPAFQGISSIGYPPPWALLLGIVYRLSYATVHNFLLYNLAIKIPIIAANICLAYLVANTLKKMNIENQIVRCAWIFMLFNPILFYFASAWGQIDSIVTLFALLALTLLNDGKYTVSAILLALAISIKPIAFPILPVALIFIWGRSHRKAFQFSITTLISFFLLCVVPFLVFSWDPSPILLNWNAHFTVAGGMSVITFFELLFDSNKLPGWWWLLGILWIPALIYGIYSLRHGVHGFIDLLKKSLVLILIFFLTRSWLSEPNIILILPLVLILASAGELDRNLLTAIWVIPLVFTMFNGSLPQLLFPSLPALMNQILLLPGEVRTVGLIARSIMVVPWQIAGWKTVVACYKGQKLHSIKNINGN
jgi:hypothetical protein